jgi:cytochrome d ubiquinol oxidase subunit I
MGAFILGAFFVMSISAWYLLKDRHVEFARRSFTGALVLALVASVGQAVSGHLQAENVAEHQPAKLAAFEGHFTQEPGRGAPLYLFGWPDAEARTVRGGVAIPGGLSFLLHGDWTAPVPALDELEPTWGSPPVWLTFQSYHIMVGIGVTMIVTTLLALVYRVRGTLWRQRWLLWYFVGAVVLAYIANQLGWMAAEVGRQPWVVYPTLLTDGTLYGGLRTTDAVSEVVSAGEVLASIIMFGLIYSLLFAVWIYVLNHKIQKGPLPVTAPARTTMGGLMDAASDKTDRAMNE